MDAINIGLDPKNWYLTFIHDPRFFIFSRNPGLPLNSKFQENDQILMYTLKMVEHHNLNVPSKHCNNSPFYSFTKCVKQAVSEEVKQSMLTAFPKYLGYKYGTYMLILLFMLTLDGLKMNSV